MKKSILIIFSLAVLVSCASKDLRIGTTSRCAELNDKISVNLRYLTMPPRNLKEAQKMMDVVDENMNLGREALSLGCKCTD